MPAILCLLLAIGTVSAAQPFLQTYFAPGPLQINPNEYYVSAPEVQSYYNQPQQKQATQNDESSRLESLDPDSEVELLPGAQQPQPPQQTPVAPNIPGLIPGQRVFIVHMPVPGLRPGTVGGYQPVYIVAAAPQGNNAYPGYQNPVVVDPSGQTAVTAPGYQGSGFRGNPNVLLSPQQPFQFAYPAYQPLAAPGIFNPYVALQQPATNQQKGAQINSEKSSQYKEETREEYNPDVNTENVRSQSPKR